jgi:DNA-binding beta-propeller fold protein YncE
MTTRSFRRPLALIAATGCAALAAVTGGGAAWGATTYSLTATVRLGESSCPNAVSVNPATHDVYVANPGCGSPMDGGDVIEINGSTDQVTAYLPLGEGRSPQGYPPRIMDVAVDPTADTVYEAVTNGLPQVSVIDAATNTLTAAIPVSAGAQQLAVDTGTHTLYATGYSSSVSVINGSTNQVTGSIALPATPGSIAADPASHTVYVATGTALSVISGNQVTATIPLPSGVGTIVTDPARHTVYAVIANAVAVIDETTQQVSATIPLTFTPAGLAVDSSADTLYASASNSSSPAVIVIDASTHQTVATVPVPSGYYPAQLGVDPSLHAAYVSAALGELPPEGTIFVIGSTGGAGGGTGSAPAVTTNPASSVSPSAATLNGTVNPQGQATTYRFDFGTSISYGTSVPSPAGSAGSGTSAATETATLTGLQSSTTYHYRLEATNATGTTYGSDQTFTTLGLAPAVTTNPASRVSSSGATLNGSVNAEGQPTTYRFDYGTTSQYGSSVPSPAGSAGAGRNAFNQSAALSGLRPGTTYHFRIEASNATGTSYGSDRTFTTARRHR